jgi:hypothetical protein
MGLTILGMATPTRSSETFVQNLIHTLEQGRMAALMKNITLGVLLFAVALAYLGWEFRGFAKAEAMDQAQISREIARGNGWSTLFLRPLAIWQIEKNIGSVPRGHIPDTYHAPLPPLVNAVVFKIVGNDIKYGNNEYIATFERGIVILSMLCFLAAMTINYFSLVRVFDRRLAFWAVCLTLLTDLCWQYTLSGLPQMLMLLIFSAALYTFLRAIEAHTAVDEAPPAPEDENAPVPKPKNRTVAVSLWLLATGGLLGLLALSHALTISIFVGAATFSFLYFRGRRLAPLALVLAFGLVYTPWLIRTYHVSGNPFGLAGYAIFDELAGSTTQRMRSLTGPNTETIAPHFFRLKLEYNIIRQVGGLMQNLGGNLLAAAFFIGLVHVFRRPETNALRWAVLTMWLSAVLGMSLLGGDVDQALGVNQIAILFLPMTLGYGLAFMLVLFGRLEIGNWALARTAFFAVIALLSSLSMIVKLLPEQNPIVQYPPYYEPVIGYLNKWTKESEIVASDMPWAVALYADRKSLWIPNKLRDVIGLSDDGKLPGTLAGVFLTPVSRGVPFSTSIYKGEYQEYVQLIVGNANIPNFPFREVAAPMGDLSYTFFSDTRRWDNK